MGASRQDCATQPHLFMHLLMINMVDRRFSTSVGAPRENSHSSVATIEK